MKGKSFIKKNKVLLVALAAYAVLFLMDPLRGREALGQTGRFLIEMIQILPPVMILSALTAVWIPRERIEAALGRNAGWKGSLVSFLIGSLSAGPIYAAFPAALVLHRKGAGLKNLVIIISSWAVIKVPLILVESSFLGVPFAALRYSLTIPAILIMGHAMERWLPGGAVDSAVSGAGQPAGGAADDGITPILEQLPGRNCGACAYSTCRALAEAVQEGNAALGQCLFVTDAPPRR